MTRSARLRAESILIDGRDPTFLLHRDSAAEKAAYWTVVESTYWNAVRASGFTALVVDVPHVADTFTQAAINFATWYERLAVHPEALVILSAADIVTAKSSGLTGFIFSAQSPTIIGADVRLLRPLHAMGLRMLEMSFNTRNLLADGCGEQHDGGLTHLGRRAIEELNRLGIVIDVAHASDLTMIETIERSTDPVVFSHSNARGLVDHRRNVPDTTLRRLAERGGVCCTTPWADFVVPDGRRVGATVSDYVDMIRYIADLVGVDHVGIGTDIVESRTVDEEMTSTGTTLIGGDDAGGRYVAGLRSRSDLPMLVDELIDAGFSDTDVAKVLGGNLLRVFQEVW